MNFELAKEFILGKIRRENPDKLYYHGIHHTLDVYGAVTELSLIENLGEEDTILLQTAALYHDAGFTVTYMDNEAIGCDIARASLPEFDYTRDQIECICGMIMSTKLPQSPNNLLEQILCDGDLDYLGREDYPEIAATLFQELQAFGLIQTHENWKEMQIRFLEGHKYFTSSASLLRSATKMKWLEGLRGMAF